MNIGELFISLGFDVDDKKLKEFKNDVKDGFEGLLKISAAAAGAVYAVNAFVEGSIRSATALRNFNIQTDLSIDKLQKWQVAGTMSNTAMSVEQVTSSVQALQQSLADISLGKGPSGQLSMLGIDGVAGKDAFDVLEELRANYQGNVAKWGLVQTNQFMKEAGIDPGLINAIRLTREEFDKLSEGKILSPEAQKKLVDLGTAVREFEINFKLMKDNLSADWSPTLIRILDNAIPMIKDFAQGLKNIGIALRDVEKHLEPFKWFIAIGAGLLLVALNPVGAVIGLIVLGLNEWGKHLQGMPSLVDDLKDAFIKLKIAIKDAFTPSKILEGLLDRIEGVYNLLHGKGYVVERDGPPQDLNERFSRIADQYDFARIMDRQLDRDSPTDRQMAGMAAGVTNTFHNAYQIHTVEDAFGVADQIVQQQQRQINYTFDSLNNGPQY